MSLPCAFCLPRDSQGLKLKLFCLGFLWQFQRHIKKSEGQKIPKVELQISIYGVKILDPKTKVSPKKYLSFFIVQQVQRRPHVSPEVPLTTNTVYRKEMIWCQHS